jgi:hypothetical protein
MLRALCIPCQYGMHDAHEPVPVPPTPGLIGSGQTCPCEGDCGQNASPDLIDPEVLKGLLLPR